MGDLYRLTAFDAASAQCGQRGTMTLINLVACYAVLAYNMDPSALQAPEHPTEQGLLADSGN